jgi:hypothetical protein
MHLSHKNQHNAKLNKNEGNGRWEVYGPSEKEQKKTQDRELRMRVIMTKLFHIP